MTGKLILARHNMLRTAPFFGCLALRLKIVPDPTCKSIWSDATTLGYNPEYVDRATDLELRALLAKVVMHIAAGHPWRQGNRNAKLWNQATAYAINPLVLESGFRLPSGYLQEDEYAGMPAELIYEVLSKKNPPKDDASPDPASMAEPGGAPDGAETDSGGESPASAEETFIPGEIRPAQSPETEAEWHAAMANATRTQGQLSASVRRIVKESLAPKVRWTEELRHLLQQVGTPSNFSWGRPSKRWLYAGMYLPSLVGQSIGTPVIARDTSGSISDSYLQEMNAEVAELIVECKPELAYLLDCDSSVKQVIEVLQGDIPDDLNALGGGGTNFCPVFEWIEKEDISPSCVIYMTDLQGRFPKEDPGYPVIWLVPEGYCKGPQPPFGTVIPLTLR
ncbi:VWA-like domain-containing protein [Nostoc sp. CHAB 5834]|nr:VWA-like domain-containing protein [Nostoc sp. CHAB 5834]